MVFTTVVFQLRGHDQYLLLRLVRECRLHPILAQSLFHGMCCHLYSVHAWNGGLSVWHFSKLVVLKAHVVEGFKF